LLLLLLLLVLLLLLLLPLLLLLCLTGVWHPADWCLAPGAARPELVRALGA
jgi:hypothetical protein